MTKNEITEAVMPGTIKKKAVDQHYTEPTALQDQQSNQHHNMNEKISEYLGEFEPMVEGHRNNGLYKAGLQLWKFFVLTGDTLETMLRELNQTKCIPPLPDSEVTAIARSISKANIPKGCEKVGSKNVRAKKSHSITYSVSTADPISVENLLQKEVSIYASCRESQPIRTSTIGIILDTFRTGGRSKELIDAVRNETDKDKRSELKKRLPAIVFGSDPQEGRKAALCQSNGMICLDFDNIPQEELELAKEKIAKVDYVVAVGLSVGGQGLFALTAYEGTPNLKALLAAMQADFCCEIDKHCSDISRLRMVTLDENLIVKTEVCPAILIEESLRSDTIESIPAKRSCGVTSLDTILSEINPIDWDACQPVNRNGEVKPPSEKDYILRGIEQLLRTADIADTPFVNNTGTIYYFTENHYKQFDVSGLTNFLVEALVRCGVPHDTAVYHTFVDKLFKQFLLSTARNNSGVTEPDTAYINLQNGTLFFDKRGHRFEPHSSLRFIRYCLPFEYDPSATAPLWQKHLDRSLPNPDKQLYLAECLALPFYQGKIEKAPIFYGARDTGKSTTLDVYRNLLGVDNISTELLATLTMADNTGAYSRAMLDGKLVNICNDISRKIADEGMLKMLISREEVPARHPYGKGFSMSKYARLVFAMNDLPPQFFTDPAITKRVAIIAFDQQIAAEDKDTNFAAKVTATELPGVLNWIIAGLDRLLSTGRLDPPTCILGEMEQIQKEVDPLSVCLEELGYIPGETYWTTIKEAYKYFVQFCKDNGHQQLSKKTFTQRLRGLGFVVERKNGDDGTVLRFSIPIPENHSDSAFVPVEEPCFDEEWNDWNEWNENLEQSFDREDIPW